MKQAYTVWKDGTHKLWSELDAHYAEQDAEWLCTIPVPGEATPTTDSRPHD